MIRHLVLAFIVVLEWSGAAAAHQASLAILSATEVQDGRFALRWENKPTASEGDDFVIAEPIWPPQCAAEEMILDCGADGLTGQLGFDGLGVRQSAAMIRITALGGASQAVMLTATRPTARLMSLEDAGTLAGQLAIARAYLALGMEHIAVGIDHLLFVFGLMLIAATRWRLVRTITAFTLAHTVTLAAVSFGAITVPEAFVNTMIALSIVFVAVEIMRREAGGTSLTLRRPEIVSFGFGLLHGLGFATALVELGLPAGARAVALAAFNLGVEAGQLAFVALVLASLAAWRNLDAPAPPRPGHWVAYGVGGLASFWFISRLALMFGDIA